MTISKSFDAVFLTDLTDTVYIFKTLGAFKVSHVLRSQGYSTLVVDHLHMWGLDEMKNLLAMVISERTKLVGISTTFLKNIAGNDVQNASWRQQYRELDIMETFCPQGKDFEIEIVKQIKKLNPKCKIMLGGHKASPETRNRNVDFVMTGHGEQSIIDLMQHLETKKPLPGAYKNVWGVTVVPGKEISGQEFAHGSMVWQKEDIFNTKVLPMEVARGCIFNCVYCAFPLRGKKNLDFVQNHDLIYQELRHNYDQFGIRTYALMDDTFNDNDEKLDRMLSVVKKLDFQPIFWCYSRLDLMAAKPDRFKKMYDIGVRAYFFGIETLNTTIGKSVGKGLDAGRQIQTINDIRNEYGDKVMLHGSFILGLPGESLDSMERTRDALHSQQLPLHSWLWNPLYIRKWYKYQSDIEKNYQSYGYRELGEEDGSVDWESDITTFQHMKQLALEWNAQAQKLPDFRLSNNQAWTLMNYTGYDFEKASRLRFSEVEWNHFSDLKIRFVAEYRRQLIQWLQKD